MSKTWFYNYWCHFMYMYSCIRHLFKMKYDEKENKKKFITKDNKSALHFISSIIPKNPIPSNLYISQV